MRNFLFLFSILVSLPSLAGIVTAYSCRTMLEEPGDPTPVQRFELRLQKNGAYTALATQNENESPMTVIGRNFMCGFTHIPACNIPNGSCVNVPASNLMPGEYESVLFRCANRANIATNELHPRITYVEGTGYLSSYAVRVFVFPQADIYDFEMGFNCRASVR